MSNVKIIYEDNHIIAVVKPASDLSQGDQTGEVSMYDIVKDYIKETKAQKFQRNFVLGRAPNLGAMEYKKPGNVFLGLVHRLDKPVSGIMLFAKTSKGAARLSEQFRNHKIQKTYYAIVAGKPKEQRATLKEKVQKISFFAEAFTEKSDEDLLKEIKEATKTRTAELSYEVVKSNEKYSLLKILPKTGRFHQIRVQMTQMGHPILGDKKYSKAKMREWKNNNSIALCATGITFKSATGNKTINLKIDLPKEWDKFI